MKVIGRRSAPVARFHKWHQSEEINLTSMIDMMTILVFFLLVHGGFIRLAILELNLPTAQAAPAKEPATFQLEITVRESSIEVGDRSTGLLKRIENTDGEYDFAGLTEYLKRVKEQFPEKTDAALLLEPDVPYDVLVSVMDRIRVAERLEVAENRVARDELFPEISIGDAPLLN
jgi:biopolymer transport protein ExbD